MEVVFYVILTSVFVFAVVLIMWWFVRSNRALDESLAAKKRSSGKLSPSSAQALRNLSDRIRR